MVAYALWVRLIRVRANLGFVVLWWYSKCVMFMQHILNQDVLLFTPTCTSRLKHA